MTPITIMSFKTIKLTEKPSKARLLVCLEEISEDIAPLDGCIHIIYNINDVFVDWVSA